jgi:hypothetical protein
MSCRMTPTTADRFCVNRQGQVVLDRTFRSFGRIGRTVANWRYGGHNRRDVSCRLCELASDIYRQAKYTEAHLALRHQLSVRCLDSVVVRGRDLIQQFTRLCSIVDILEQLYHNDNVTCTMLANCRRTLYIADRILLPWGPWS